MTRKPSRAATLRKEGVEALHAGRGMGGRKGQGGLEVDLRDSLAKQHYPAPHAMAGKGSQQQQGQDGPPCPPDLQLVVPHVGGGGSGGKAQVRQRGVGSQLALESLVGRGVAAAGWWAESCRWWASGEHRHLKASSSRGMLEAKYQGSTRHTALLTRRPQRRRWRRTGWRGCRSSPAPPPAPPAKCSGASTVRPAASSHVHVQFTANSGLCSSIPPHPPQRCPAPPPARCGVPHPMHLPPPAASQLHSADGPSATGPAGRSRASGAGL